MKLRKRRLGVGVAWLFISVLAISSLPGSRLWAEEPKERATLQTDTVAVSAVAFSPESKMLASGSVDKTIKLWDIKTCKMLTSLQGHTDVIQSVTFSPDGEVLASGSNDGSIKLWDIKTSKVLTTLQGHSDAVLRIAFSPDRRTLASGSCDKTIKLWDLKTDKERVTLQGHTDFVSSVAFSPDGEVLASGSVDRTIKLWDMTTGKEKATLQGHTKMVYSVAFSPDGKMVASGGLDQTIRLWEVTTGNVRITLQVQDWVNSLAYCPDGKTVVSGNRDGTIQLWNLQSGKVQTTFQEPKGRVLAVACSPDGKMVASGGDCTLKLWDIRATKSTGAARSGLLAPGDLDGLWSTLAVRDAVKAYQAINTLVGVPDQAVLLIKERVRPVSKPDTQEITRWITDLESDQFVVRQQASEELEKKDDMAESALRTKLAEKPSVEVRQRIEKLLSKIEQLSPKGLQALRAVEVLESLGNPEAKEVLETLAAGVEGAKLTQEAKASLARLNKRGR